MSKKKRTKYFNIGDILVKRNYTPFGHDNKFITITVESIDFFGISYVINKLYKVMPNTVIKITEEEKRAILKEWHFIGISEYYNTTNDPCIRLETGLPKVIVQESDIKSLVYQFRHKYNNPAFEVYKCPKCNNLHLGKNINKLCQQ